MPSQQARPPHMRRGKTRTKKNEWVAAASSRRSRVWSRLQAGRAEAVSGMHSASEPAVHRRELKNETRGVGLYYIYKAGTRNAPQL